MTVVSSKEFVTNQKKYFDLAMSGDVCIKRGETMFHLICNPKSCNEDYFALDDIDAKQSPKTLGDFFGVLSEYECLQLREHITQARKEWDMDFYRQFNCF